jgi:transcriptional regulator with XRE-family HTH domain
MSEGMVRALLRAAREANGWSQAELAREAGVSAGAVARLERGDTLPTDWTRLARLARALGLPKGLLGASVPRANGAGPTRRGE